MSLEVSERTGATSSYASIVDSEAIILLTLIPDWNLISICLYISCSKIHFGMSVAFSDQ